MRLYDLQEKYLQLLELAEQGESEALLTTLEMLEDSIEDKIDNTVKMIRTLEAQADACKKEKERFAEREKHFNKQKDWLKEYLEGALEGFEGEKVKTTFATVWRQNNPTSTQIIDEEKIPQQYMIPQAPRPDKKAIINAWKQGEEVPGTELKQSKGVRIK